MHIQNINFSKAYSEKRNNSLMTGFFKIVIAFVFAFISDVKY